jgi:hypothetical protein
VSSTDPTFAELIANLRRVSHDQFALDFGGIDADIVAMLLSPKARKVRERERLEIESGTFADGVPRLNHLQFGDFSSAPELAGGEVAAIDGANVLPLQQYSIGQAVCVAVGSVSHTRALSNALHYWSTKFELDQAKGPKEFHEIQHKYLFGLNPSGLLRYLETRHALEIAEPYIFLDGPIVYEWLAGQSIGVDLYAQLLNEKKAIGIIKNLTSTKGLAMIGSVLRPGEYYVAETLEAHLTNHQVHMAGDFLAKHARHIYRGVFKPALTAYGFEVHKDNFTTMLRLVAADCVLDHIGHEIPYLLDLVDTELRSNSPGNLLKNQIATSMHLESEQLYFENTDEFDFR